MEDFVVNPSGDAESSDLWKLPIGEVEKIQSDPDHPRHDEANEVIAKALAPISDALALKLSQNAAELSARMSETIAAQVGMPKIDVSKIIPNVDLSWAGPKINTKRVHSARPIFIQSPNSTIDFTSEVQPDATVSDIHDGAEETVAEWGRLADLQQARMTQAQTHADDQLAESKSTRKIGVLALIGSWVAAVASVVTIFLTIYFSD